MEKVRPWCDRGRLKNRTEHWHVCLTCAVASCCSWLRWGDSTCLSHLCSGKLLQLAEMRWKQRCEICHDVSEWRCRQDVTNACHDTDHFSRLQQTHVMSLNAKLCTENSRTGKWQQQSKHDGVKMNYVREVDCCPKHPVNTMTNINTVTQCFQQYCKIIRKYISPVRDWQSTLHN